VLAKLLNLVGPDRMYMGQKDAQQAVVTRRMMRDLGFPARLVVCPTVREADGLAISSRNVYLSADEREAAAAIPKALSAAVDEALSIAGGSPAALAERLRERAKAELARESRLEMEYVSADDHETLGAVTGETGEILLSCAALAGGTRLIDNAVVRLEGDRPANRPVLGSPSLAGGEESGAPL